MPLRAALRRIFGGGAPVSINGTLESNDLLERADLARDLAEYARAADLYDQFLANNPTSAAILIQSAHMHKEAEAYLEAEARYDRALELTPDDPDLNLQLGHFYKRTGRFEHAMDAYRRAADLAVDWIEPRRCMLDLRQTMILEAQQAVTESHGARLRARLGEQAIQALIAEMREQEPAIGDTDGIVEFLVPPHHDPMHAAHEAVRARLPTNRFDTVVCVPWLRNGGADLVACCLASTLRRIRPTASILILRTDYAQFERPDWIEAGIDTCDISDILDTLAPAAAERLLYTVLLGLAPRQVINVNSRRCWRVFVRFGARLCSQVPLFAYLFCWDLSPHGTRAGYPSEFYPPAAPHLSGVMTDTVFLQREIQRIYRLPPQLLGRLRALPTPMMGEIAVPSVAEQGVLSRSRRDRPMILWGARLDRQKRFDLLGDVARLMPEVDFQCWGVALLDAPPDISDLPANLRMMGAFHWIADLPLAEADGWLYTSAWEGMPLALIELARLGVPVVASDAGGISELLDNSTGWLVPADAPAGAYVTALREIISRTDERVLRARALQARVAERHAPRRYDAILGAVLDAGDGG